MNHSAKVILAVAYLTHAASCFEMIRTEYFGADPTGGLLIKDGGERDIRTALRGHVVRVPGHDSNSPVVSVDLGLVVFTDGEMVGPNKLKCDGDVLARIKSAGRGPVSLWRAK